MRAVGLRLARHGAFLGAVALGLVAAGCWAGPGAAAAATAPRSAQAVLLINGDRVVSSSAAGGRGLAVAPAARQGLAAASLNLKLGAHRYLLPAAAIPYLNRGLAWSLFDLTALARAERAGRLPVTIRYRARRHALPGVTVTRSGGGVASGYLTVSSARRFGAALIRQFRADHAAGRYGRDGMFAGGESVALAGAAVVAARPDLPMHVLTVTATNVAGRPDTGDLVLVVNEDNSGLFNDPIESVNDFYRGSTKFSVPAGNYFALGMFFGSSGATRLVVLPHVSVPSSGPAVTVPMAASAASSRITFTTPRPARVSDVEATLVSQPAKGLPADLSFDNGNLPLYLSHTTAAPPVGRLYLAVNGLLRSPSTAPSRYEYNVVYQDTSGVIGAQHYTVAASSLATLRERFFQAGRARGGYLRIAFYPWEQGYSATVYPQALPGQRTVYATADPAALWGAQYWQSYQTLAGGQEASPERYLPGQTPDIRWNAGPLHAGTNVNLVGAANIFFPVPSASRSGNTLALDVTPFSDNQLGHLGSGFQPGIFGSTGKITGSYEVDQNGRKIASGSAVRAAGGAPDLFAETRLRPRPSLIRFTVSASRTGRAYGLVTSSRTVWTWRSARQPGTALPAGWVCPVGNTCVVQPMLTMRYSLPGLRLNESAPPGRQVLDFSAARLQLAAPAAVRHATVQVSVNGGKTWRPVRVSTAGPGAFRAVFRDRQAGLVSLRVTASDPAGGRIKETILSAYRVS